MINQRIFRETRLVKISLALLFFFWAIAATTTAGALGPLSYEIQGNAVTITDCDETVTNVVIPARIEGLPVESVGEAAFWGCRALTNCVLLLGVTNINASAFTGCRALKHIELPDGLIQIGAGAFFGCDSLTKMELPTSLESIGSGAFVCVAQWDGIEHITIPRAFHGCRVSSLIVAEENQHYFSSGEVLFNADQTELVACLNGKSGSYTVPDGVAKIDDAAFQGCHSLTSITLPAGVTNLGSFAFDSCGGLTSLSIPRTVTEIGRMAFSFCDSLTSFEVEEGNPRFMSADGILFSADQTELVAFPKTRSGVYGVPKGVVKIGASAFSDCRSLTKVTLPDGLCEVGTYAFSSCYSLEEITFPASVKRIDDDVFSCCRKLKKAVLWAMRLKSLG